VPGALAGCYGYGYGYEMVIVAPQHATLHGSVLLAGVPASCLCETTLGEFSIHGHDIRENTVEEKVGENKMARGGKAHLLQVHPSIINEAGRHISASVPAIHAPPITQAFRSSCCAARAVVMQTEHEAAAGLSSPAMIFTASITMRPEMMALVVAMACMMLPAMPLASNSCERTGRV